MPTTRKKVIKTVYKNEDSEDETGDFSDSGSEAKISAEESSTDEEDEVVSSGDEFRNTLKQSKCKAPLSRRNPKPFAKTLINKFNKTMYNQEGDTDEIPPISVKDLTDADKLLPTVLNLSESDSSDDEEPKSSAKKKMSTPSTSQLFPDSDSDKETNTEYKDVFSNNFEESTEIAQKAFLELELHKTKVEATKASIQSYKAKQEDGESDVKDLLALGEEVVPQTSQTPSKKKVKRRVRDNSDSELEDWEEVKESKAIPKQGLQVIVDLPDCVSRKTKKVDVEMMMKRKINRVKKEYQVYMHKVHVLCWLGHGNYVSRVLNDQELMAAALSLVPSKGCYPGERVDMKYLEHIVVWYRDKITINQDKNEDKYRPKALPLKNILINQLKTRVVTTKKYLIFIFVSMLRALGLQCRVMFNFVTLPLKPPTSELCSLSTKPKEEKADTGKTSTTKKASNKKTEANEKDKKKTSTQKNKSSSKISQIDGNFDYNSDSDFDNLIQLDGSNDVPSVQTRKTRATKTKNVNNDINKEQDVSPPKRAKTSPSPKTTKRSSSKVVSDDSIKKGEEGTSSRSNKEDNKSRTNKNVNGNNETVTILSPRKTRSTSNAKKPTVKETKSISKTKSTSNTNAVDASSSKVPEIVITDSDKQTSSKYFENKPLETVEKQRLSRKRSQTTNVTSQKSLTTDKKQNEIKLRTRSAPNKSTEKSKYFSDDNDKNVENKRPRLSLNAKHLKDEKEEDKQRVSHRDLNKQKSKNDVTGDLVKIIKNRVKEAKEESKQGIVKGKLKKESDEDSDFLPEEDDIKKANKQDSDDDFKPKKVSPKASTSKKPVSRKIDRRVLSSDEDTPKNKSDVWCEVYVEELEQWVPIDILSGKLHCPEYIYAHATHPVAYVVGWDNNNYLKDLTRRYVPHWNTVTRKQRTEPPWWTKALQPWLGPKTARDKEEDLSLDMMQLEAPLPKSIAEYKNHPLYALKRHLLKYEAIYPPDTATLGFVRGEAVYARDCVYTCRSRDTWLKEAKVVRLAEEPYKIVKARPKWDKLSNKCITDKPLEIFGPWQVQDYEPPVAENGIVPRNAYGNVELFKECMLPKGTVHIKLPGLNKVAKKLNIDCAPAMTGFDFNGGWSHPVYDGFVVCEEFGEIITDAWLKDQEEQERKEQEKTEARVYGNWRRLIRGLFIKERLKCKYGFEDPSTSQDKKKSTGPRLVVKKK